MSLINLGKNYKEQIEKNRERDRALQETVNRFKYPKEPNNSDMIGTLLPISWDNIYFPISDFSTEVSQSIVEHKYPNRDSARLEAMGRNPLIFKATAVFVNTIVPGPNDRWEQGSLYPEVYNKLLLASFSGETKILQHPEIGNISCKILSFNPIIDARFRGGVVVKIEWKETIAEDDIDATLESLQNVIASAKQTAAALDNMMPNLTPSPKDLEIPEYKDSLEDTVNKIVTLINAPGKFAGQIIGTIDSLEGRCKLINNKIKRNYKTTWGQANQLSYKLKADAQEFRKLTKSSRVDANKVIAYYVVEKRTVFTNLAFRLKNTYQQLVDLNPFLVKFRTILPGTNVRYYK